MIRLMDIGGGIGGSKPPFTVEQCDEMIDAIQEAMFKLLKSGTKSYHIGSRGLERLSFKDLQDALSFWVRMKQIAETGSGMVARRAIPCDL
jgi:hypothetical protein